MSNKQKAGKTYFGFAALIAGMVSLISIAARFAIACMDVSPRAFGLWNQITTLFFCILTPLAFALAVLGFRSKNDSKSQSGIGMTLAIVPFALLLLQFALAFFESGR
jgi:cytochrome bd-type quinol oxidase subunit 2